MPDCHSESFAFCSSEEAKRPKNLAQSDRMKKPLHNILTPLASQEDFGKITCSCLIYQAGKPNKLGNYLFATRVRNL